MGLSCMGLSGLLGVKRLFLSPFSGNFLLLSSHALSFGFFFWNAYNSNNGVLNIVPEVSKAVLFYFYSFLCSASFISTISSSSSLILSSASVLLLSVPLSVFLICYCIVHYRLTILYCFWILVKHFLNLLSPCFWFIYLYLLLFSRF